MIDFVMNADPRIVLTVYAGMLVVAGLVGGFGAAWICRREERKIRERFKC